MRRNAERKRLMKLVYATLHKNSLTARYRPLFSHFRRTGHYFWWLPWPVSFSASFFRRDLRYGAGPFFSFSPSHTLCCSARLSSAPTAHQNYRRENYRMFFNTYKRPVSLARLRCKQNYQPISANTSVMTFLIKRDYAQRRNRERWMMMVLNTSAFTLVESRKLIIDLNNAGVNSLEKVDRGNTLRWPNAVTQKN